jgi:hypothetical protein
MQRALKTAPSGMRALFGIGAPVTGLLPTTGCHPAESRRGDEGCLAKPTAYPRSTSAHDGRRGARIDAAEAVRTCSDPAVAWPAGTSSMPKGAFLRKSARDAGGLVYAAHTSVGRRLPPATVHSSHPAAGGRTGRARHDQQGGRDCVVHQPEGHRSQPSAGPQHARYQFRRRTRSRYPRRLTARSCCACWDATRVNPATSATEPAVRLPRRARRCSSRFAVLPKSRTVYSSKPRRRLTGRTGRDSQ